MLDSADIGNCRRGKQWSQPANHQRLLSCPSGFGAPVDLFDRTIERPGEHAGRNVRQAGPTSRGYVSVSTWLTLAVTALGIAGTLGGSWLTQRRADKRETTNWNRELQREQARWSREDAARTYEFRRAAYVAYYEAAGDHAQDTFRYMMEFHIRNLDEVESPKDGTLSKALHLIQIYGSPRVLDLAKQTQKACWTFRNELTLPDFDIGPEINRLQDEFDVVLTRLLGAIRNELGVPDDRSKSRPD